MVTHLILRRTAWANGKERTDNYEFALSGKGSRGCLDRNSIGDISAVS